MEMPPKRSTSYVAVPNAKRPEPARGNEQKLTGVHKVAPYQGGQEVVGLTVRKVNNYVFFFNKLSRSANGLWVEESFGSPPAAVPLP